jgi:V8-like Glu-specific endopeptidase
MEYRPIEGPPVEWLGPEAATTAATEAALAEGTGPGGAQDEIVVGLNNLKPVVHLEVGSRLARAVAHITLPGRGAASGFMIDADVLMTNHHVFRQPSDAANATVRFGYQVDLAGNLMASEAFACEPEGFFHASDALDYAVVRIARDAGASWGSLKPAPEIPVKSGQDVIIIQHPGGQPKQVGLVDNEVVVVQPPFVQYLTDTMPGSSGSPVFDEHWNLIAIHHSGGWFPQPAADSTHYRNEGVLMSAIVADLPPWR